MTRHPPLPPVMAGGGSRRMAGIQSPIIPVIAALASRHPGTISLGQGVVFYGPPEAALEAARRFGSESGDHRYGPVRGQPALLAAIGRKLLRENGVDPDAGRRVIVTAGANMAFLNAILAIADPGDEIVLPLPYYFNQEMAVRMIGCTPVFAPTDGACQLRLDALRAAITARTRAIVTVSPNNPSGAVYPEADLRAVNALCRAHGLYHISDEAYEYFTWDGARHVSPASIAGSEAHTIALYSLSKAYGFASWRIGYLVIPEHLEPALLKIQDTNLICAPLIAQVAATAALEIGRAHWERHRPALAAVRDIVREQLGASLGVQAIPEARGAFYYLLRVDTRMDSLELARRLIIEHGVAVIPGTAFGVREPACLRVSYGALEPATAREGLRRLVSGLRALTNGPRA